MYLLRLFSQPCSSRILTQARQRAAEQQGVFPRQDVHGVICVFPQGKGDGDLAIFRALWIAEYRTKHQGIPPLH